MISLLLCHYPLLVVSLDVRDVHDRYRSRDIQDRFLKAGFTGQSPEKDVFDTVLGKGRLGNVKWVSIFLTQLLLVPLAIQVAVIYLSGSCFEFLVCKSTNRIISFFICVQEQVSSIRDYFFGFMRFGPAENRHAYDISFGTIGYSLILARAFREVGHA